MRRLSYRSFNITNKFRCTNSAFSLRSNTRYSTS
nr:MAG TPA: hypothetical protein [Caudoviricetes sp.]